MRPPLALRAFLLLCLTVFGSAHAAQFVAPSPGLQIQLVTGLSTFEVPADSTNLTAAERRRSYIRAASFPASVALSNLGSSDVVLVYRSATEATARFTFTVLDHAGVAVWDSSAAIEDGAIEQSVALKARSTWRRNIQVPLKAQNGEWLSAGRYTLRVNAGQASATLPFEITTAPLPQETGVKGQVFFHQFPILGPIRAPFPSDAAANSATT